MKFRIAICDDEQEQLDIITKCLDLLKITYDFELEVLSFQTGNTLIQAHRKCNFDIILLDIELKHESGLDIALMTISQFK